MFWAIFISGAVLAALSAIELVWHVQKCGYRGGEYFRFLTVSVFAPNALATVTAVLAVQALQFAVSPWQWQLLGLLVPQLILLVHLWSKKHVPPVKFSKRCLRLIGTVFAFDLLLGLGLAFLVTGTQCFVGIGAFFAALQIGIVPLAALVLQPLERKIARGFETRAKARFATVAPKVIAVTGSYGKTGVKNLLAQLLSAKYRVCASPENYNTPQGLSITLNRFLKDGDEILIAEMGARYKGDIAQLCRLVPPDIAVITGIGTQHLATFGSIETLKNTKYELVEALAAGAHAFFGAGDGCRELWERSTGAKHFVDDKTDECTVAFSDVRSTCAGSEFGLRVGTEETRVSTRLLGAHNLSNLRLACMVAVHLGLSIDEIASGILSAVPVPHRLELLPTRHGVTVIDDSYNASAEGMVAASDVLKMFSASKVVITPGIVEAGQNAAAVNREAGRVLGLAADEVWFYGPNKDYLAEGAQIGGLPPEAIHQVADRNSAVAESAKLQTPRVVMFCNDLPT